MWTSKGTSSREDQAGMDYYVTEEQRLREYAANPNKSFDYEELCRLDVLGLKDTPEHDQHAVYAEFQEQLVRHPEGWYETSLLWKSFERMD